jgi:hypothetical protein
MRIIFFNFFYSISFIVYSSKSKQTSKARKTKGNRLSVFKKEAHVGRPIPAIAVQRFFAKLGEFCKAYSGWHFAPPYVVEVLPRHLYS